MESRGIPCEFLSVQKKQYDSFKIDGLYREKVATYPNRVLEKELKELDLLNGKNVDHPDDGSKDESDAVAGAVSHALQEEDIEVAMCEVDSDNMKDGQDRGNERPGMLSFKDRKSLIWG